MSRCVGAYGDKRHDAARTPAYAYGNTRCGETSSAAATSIRQARTRCNDVFARRKSSAWRSKKQSDVAWRGVARLCAGGEIDEQISGGVTLRRDNNVGGVSWRNTIA